MGFRLELTEDTLLLSKATLKEVLHDLIEEIQEDKQQAEVMTIREAAEYLKVSVPTLRNMIASKEIPFFQRGQVIRLNRFDLKEWIRYQGKDKNTLIK